MKAFLARYFGQVFFALASTAYIAGVAVMIVVAP